MSSPADAVTQIRKDLLDAYQSRLVEYLDEAASESERGYEPAVAESLAIASGYWGMLAPEYQEQRGAVERDEADREFAALPGFAATPKRVPAAVDRAEALLNHFTAAPFTPEEQARRAQQLIRFIDLIPVEYDHGVSGTEVTTPFEITEGIAFVDAGQSALNDLSPELEKLDPQGLTDLESVLDELSGYLDDANEGGTVVPLETIEDAHDRATALIDESFPAEWKESSDEADYDLVQISLDQMEAAVSAGQPQTAEQARLTAYAFFEFGPEIKLKAFDPGLSTEIEGLMWYGARGFDGLASQIADGAGARDIRTTRIELDDALEDAQAKTGEGESATTVITNSALIVFREGLEAILIIAAITASMIGTKRELRRPILRGALLAVPASIALFLTRDPDPRLALAIRREARGGGRSGRDRRPLLVAQLVLPQGLLDGVDQGPPRTQQGAAGQGVGAARGGAADHGLYLLGFRSVFREGFETVLFLQSLQLSSGTGIVLGGVTLGLAATAVVGYATFALSGSCPTSAC